MARSSSRRFGFVAPAVVLLAAAPVALMPWIAEPAAAQLGQPGQIEVEDLAAPPAGPSAEPDVDAIDRPRIAALHAAALSAEATEPEAALELYDRVLAALDLLSTEGLEATDRQLALDAGARAARLHDEFGEDPEAEAQLRRLIELVPGADTDSSALAELLGDRLRPVFKRLRDRMVGEIAFALEPPDADVRIDGRRTTSTLEPIAVLAGDRTLEIRRAGYAPIIRPLEVAAGQRATLELELERQTPVLRLATRPAGALVLLDGEPRGSTIEPTAALTDAGQSSTNDTPPPALDRPERPTTTAPGFLADGMSAELIFEVAEFGLRRLEVRAEGFRPYSAELQILEPIDYRMPPIVLEPEGGTLVLSGVPSDAVLKIDGDVVQPEVPGASRSRLPLPPGDYLATVEQGSSTRMFSARVQIADRQTVELPVVLRPGLAFLGVAGGSGAIRDSVAQRLRQLVDTSDDWAWIDRTDGGTGLLDRLGLSPPRLRIGSDVDWSALQERLDREAPGLLYLLAVGSDDPLAPSVELLLLPAVPGPAVPSRLALDLGGRSDGGLFPQVLRREITLQRPWIGALWIDSDAEDHPVIAAVTPASPADDAGLRPGERVVAVDGATVSSAGELGDRLQATEPGTSVELLVRNVGPDRSVQVQVGVGAWAAIAERATPLGRVPAAAWATLTVASAESESANRWLLDLQRARLLIDAGRRDEDAAAEAAGILQSVRGPQTSHGYGQAAVDYWTGVAFETAGPRYRQQALEAYRRAAAVPDARMTHPDGPWIAPRAEARLRALGSPDQSAGASPGSE
ncbi:MAG: PDZ domain-containing protein [Acidobacteriota bacterium]